VKPLKIVRAVEWWEYKFPPILVGVYVMLTNLSPAPLYNLFNCFVLIVLSLITGAVYVSILNDVTDLQEDKRAGKQNRMSSYKRLSQLVFVCIPLVPAVFFAWYLRQNLLSMSLYVSCYIVFTLYSLPPVRLKKRGFPGIIADATGSQMLPTLYAAACASAFLNISLHNVEWISLALWSFCFGLRGILWHQFHDMENDKKSGLRTWVQSLSHRKTKITGIILISIEVFALCVLLINTGQYVCFLSLGLYLVYLYWRYKKNAVEIVMFRYTRANYCIFMNEYYQVFLPLALLMGLAAGHHEYLYLLIVHVLIFPMGSYRVLKHSFSYQ